jgi:hypothetical protein
MEGGAPHVSNDTPFSEAHFKTLSWRWQRKPQHPAACGGSRAGGGDSIYDPFTTRLHELSVRPGTIVGEPLLRIQIVDERRPGRLP